MSFINNISVLITNGKYGIIKNKNTEIKVLCSVAPKYFQFSEFGPIEKTFGQPCTSTPRHNVTVKSQ